MKYGLQNIETGEIVMTFVSMREFLDHFPKGLDEDNRKSFKIVNLKWPNVSQGYGIIQYNKKQV